MGSPQTEAGRAWDKAYSKRIREARRAAGKCAIRGCENPPTTAECPSHSEMHRRRRRASYIKKNSAEQRVWIKLRGAGYEGEEARALAAAFAASETRCEICGVPNKFLATLTRLKQTPPFGMPRFWTRLQIDHVAWSPPRVRPLCYFCNHRRGKGRYTDAEVWLKAHQFWTWLLPTKELKWLIPRRKCGS